MGWRGIGRDIDRATRGGRRQGTGAPPGFERPSGRYSALERGFLWFMLIAGLLAMGTCLAAPYLDGARRSVPYDQPLPVTAPPPYGATGGAGAQPYVAPSYAPPSDSGRVQVRGYYRKDGTYVRPHTRSR